MSIIIGIGLIVAWIGISAWICLRPRPYGTDSAWGYFFGSWTR